MFSNSCVVLLGCLAQNQATLSLREITEFTGLDSRFAEKRIADLEAQLLERDQ